jgi:hypothetical protein
MKRMLSSLLAALLLAPATAPAADGPPAPPRVGDHVRVTLLAGPPPTIGRLLPSDAHALRLRLDDAAAADTAARRIPRASIATLELDRSHGHAGTGALLGAGVGLFVGLVLAGSVESRGEYDWREFGYIAGGPFYGAALGAIAGALVRTERWEARPLPSPADAAAPDGR